MSPTNAVASLLDSKQWFGLSLLLQLPSSRQWFAREYVVPWKTCLMFWGKNRESKKQVVTSNWTKDSWPGPPLLYHSVVTTRQPVALYMYCIASTECFCLKPGSNSVKNLSTNKISPSEENPISTIMNTNNARQPLALFPGCVRGEKHFSPPTWPGNNTRQPKGYHSLRYAANSASLT